MDLVKEHIYFRFLNVDPNWTQFQSDALNSLNAATLVYKVTFSHLLANFIYKMLHSSKNHIMNLKLQLSPISSCNRTQSEKTDRLFFKCEFGLKAHVVLVPGCKVWLQGRGRAGMLSLPFLLSVIYFKSVVRSHTYEYTINTNFLTPSSNPVTL